ncbi:hypothetical protein [Cellulosimicrobium sp. Marseille-Q4280]|uniref:hypothetical protein n=1 Tax=Cellulosimicrobium sp. Marseille-Q4280 TaxID=2937992 RepID=UPI0020412D10|nr:hypothetical protein [Cellulosimicrobium sp. Marseille-Q4280]
MSFNESQHVRTPAGVSTGGQFAASARSESAVDLAATRYSGKGMGFFRQAEIATQAVIPLLPGARDDGENCPQLHWPHAQGDDAAHDDEDISAGVQVFADIMDSEVPNGTWRLSRGGVEARSGLRMDAHPAAVAAWLTQVRQTDDGDLANYPEEARDSGVTKAVAAQIEDVTSWDEGGGETIWYGSRENPEWTGDHAYLAPAGDGDGDPVWHFQRADTDGQNDDVAVSDIPVGADPAAAAAWIREQAQRFGSVPFKG